MEKLTPKEWSIKTCLDIKKRKEKAAARKKKADMEARQILIQSSVNSKIRYYRQRKK